MIISLLSLLNNGQTLNNYGYVNDYVLSLQQNKSNRSQTNDPESMAKPPNITIKYE